MARKFRLGNKMNIIIAPHPDDAVIGCYSLIKKGLIDWVIYIDPTLERFEFAKTVGKKLGFSVDKLDFKDLYSYLEKARDQGYTCLVPDATDHHPLHKAVNSVAKMSGCKLGYYSVDMVASFVRELPEEDKKSKRALLNRFYFGQSSLWESDWKYFLFEGTVIEFPLVEGRK